MNDNVHVFLILAAYFGVGLLWSYMNVQELPRSTPVIVEFLFFALGVLAWPIMWWVAWYLDSRR